MRTIVNNLRDEDNREYEEAENRPETHKNDVGDCSGNGAVEIKKKTGKANEDIAYIMDPEDLGSIKVDTVEEV